MSRQIFLTAILATLLLLSISAAPVVAAVDAQEPSCMPWSSITSVTFSEGQITTTRRRTTNLPTLNCYGNCPSDARLLAAQCQQTGVSDDGTPSWKCYPKFATSISRRRYAFSTVRVECEGCTRKGDDKVIQKSCVLYYSVQAEGGISRHGQDHLPSADNTLSVFMMVLLIFFLVLVARKIFCTPTPQVVYDPNVATGYPVAGYGGGYGGGYYGGGGGGFGTGMLTGFLVGDAIGSMSHNHHYGGGGYDDAGYSGGGGGGWGDGAGFGGSDAA